MLVILFFYLTTALAQNCQLIQGTYYCRQVREIVYSNVGFQGSYDRIVSFNSDGTCSSVPFSFSGSVAPLDEELTVHFRGPVKIKQFAVYRRQQTWSQIAYYNPRDTSYGVTFMNNLGGQGSGVFDFQFGLSVSYAASDGITAATGPEILNDVLLPSKHEIMIFSDKECKGDCGYYRPGIPAYHGFGGANKMFAFEFSMPYSDGNDDIPSIWLLNAQIPRTVQYGPADCSCWISGCGELDVFEALSPRMKYLTSHLHSGNGKGSTDYFSRPISNTMKAVVVFQDDGTISIIQLDDDADFTHNISNDIVKGWRSSSSL